MGIFSIVKQIDTPMSVSVLLNCKYCLYSDCEPEDGSGPRVAKYTKSYERYYISVVGVYDKQDNPVKWTARMVVPVSWNFYDGHYIDNDKPRCRDLEQVIENESDLIAFESLAFEAFHS